MSLVLPTFPYHLIPATRVEHIAIASDWQILDVSPNAWRFMVMHPASLERDMDLREYLPELYGMEEQLLALSQNAATPIRIDKIQRDYHPDTSCKFHFNLTIDRTSWPSMASEQSTESDQLVVTLEDITPQATIEQQLVQYSNEALLIEQRLSAAQQYIQVLSEAIPYGLIVTNQSGVIQSLNPASQRIFIDPDATLVGQSISRIIPDSQLLTQLNAQELQHQLIQCRNFRNELINVECSCRAIDLHLESFLGFVFTFRTLASDV